MVHRALFGSRRMDWETPRELFRLLNREFHFVLDVCATRVNAKCRRAFTPANDGLGHRWTGRCWMNPPYGHAMARWVRKALVESSRGATVVCLLPARTDTAWWHDYVMRAREIRLLRGRLRFVGAMNAAPYPSAVVIFDRARQQRRSPRVIAWDWRQAATSFAHNWMNRPPRPHSSTRGHRCLNRIILSSRHRAIVHTH